MADLEKGEAGRAETKEAIAAVPHVSMRELAGYFLKLGAFVKGATAAAVGAIAGAAVILGEGALVDLVTIGIFGVALVVLYFKKLKEPYVVGLAGLVGVLVLHG